MRGDFITIVIVETTGKSYHNMSVGTQGISHTDSSQFPSRRSLTVGLIQDAARLEDCAGALRYWWPNAKDSSESAYKVSRCSLKAMLLGNLCSRSELKCIQLKPEQEGI